MKTITTKNALKLFLFLLILFSAKAISSTKLPNDESSSGSGSRIGYVKAKNNSKTPSTTSRSNAMQSKNIALRTTATPRVSL